ncbi:hypothetical protein [Desulfopila sp. IMCC35008]|uniref:hypothetical protein n=1 Tax=Desulfopila sp. IMCC35008 TaxID=2653858 RepID=UPI0013D44461|nr:hypothetical protein [Desulfopila sp. IMCC35008]
MVKDIRIDITIRTHRKFRKLRKRLGTEGPLALIYLWIGAASSRPDGRLTGWDDDDIAFESEWDGNPEDLVTALIDFQFLEKDSEGTYSLHDWADHQPWVIGAEDRRRKARHAAQARWQKREECTPHAPSMPEASDPHADGNAPFLSFPYHKELTASDDAEEVEAAVYLSKKKKKLSGQVLDDFNRFWESFDYRKGKAEAADAFLNIYSPALMEIIIAGATFEAKGRQALVDQGRTPKMAQGWLSGRRWEDCDSCPDGCDCKRCQYNQDPSFPCRNLSQENFDPLTCKSFRTTGGA